MIDLETLEMARENARRAGEAIVAQARRELRDEARAELETIKGWAQAQHDADGEALAKENLRVIELMAEAEMWKAQQAATLRQLEAQMSPHEVVARMVAAEEQIVRLRECIKQYEDIILAQKMALQKIAAMGDESAEQGMPQDVASSALAPACSCGEPSPDRLVVHRTDGPCYLRPKPEPQGQENS